MIQEENNQGPTGRNALISIGGLASSLLLLRVFEPRRILPELAPPFSTDQRLLTWPPVYPLYLVFLV